MRRIDKAFLPLALVTGVAFLLAALRYHFVLVTFPFQAEMREGAMLLSTHGWDCDVNVFAYGNLPEYTNVLNLVYNKTVALFAGLPLYTTALHRGVSGVFLLATAALLYAVQRRLRVPAWLALVGSVLAYLGFLYGVVPLARPDAMGLFLYAAALCVPFLFRFNMPSLLATAAFGVVAFYTKLYFVIAVPVVLAFVFLFVSKRNALVAAVAFLVLFAGSAGWVHHACPTFFREVVLGMDNLSNYHRYVVKLQLRDLFLRHNAGFTLLLAALVWRHRKTKPADVIRFARSVRFRVNNWNEGLLDMPPPFFLFAAACALVALVVKFGGHDGSYLNYFLELFAPLYIVETVRQASAAWLNRWVVWGCCTISLFTAYLFLNGVAPDLREFRKAERLLKNQANPLCHPSLASILLANGQPVYDSGLTEYFKDCAYVKSKTLGLFFDDDPAWAKRAADYANAVYDNIANKRYTLVVAPRNPDYWLNLDSLLDAHYRIIDSLDISMPQYANERFLLYVRVTKSDTATAGVSR